MKAIIYSAVLLVLLAVGATSLTCYICNSVNDTKCGHGSDVDPAYAKECVAGMGQMVAPEGQPFTLCRKIVTNIDFDVNTNKKGERVSRVCGWEESKYDNDCYYRGGLGGRTTVCTCNSDKCNGANTFGAAVTTILLPSIFLTVKYLTS